MDGDSSIVATGPGLVSVGCCGHGDRQPSLDTPLLMAWVDQAGQPLGVAGPEVWLEYPDGDTMVVVRSFADSQQRWTLPGVQSGRDMPPVVATDDGGALMWLDDWGGGPEPPAVLYEMRPDGSIESYAMGSYNTPVAMHSSRFVVVLGDDGYVRLRLP